METQNEPAVLVEHFGPIRVVTLNRPEHRNAANNAIHSMMAAVWSDIADDPGTRCVVLTGAGSAFSAGGDLREWVDKFMHDPVRRRAGMVEARRIVREMVDFPLPIVAAVNGPAVGFGCTLALLSDIVLMSDRAYLADPHVSGGVVAGDGGAVVWPLLTSLAKAKEYLLLGDRIPATVAVELGLANRVVPHNDVMGEALALAQRLASLPPRSVQDTKRALNLHLDRAMNGVLDYGLSAEDLCVGSPEHLATIAEFLED